MPISKLDGSKESNCKKAWLREQKYSCCCLFVIRSVLLPLPFLAFQVAVALFPVLVLVFVLVFVLVLVFVFVFVFVIVYVFVNV